MSHSEFAARQRSCSEREHGPFNEGRQALKPEAHPLAPCTGIPVQESCGLCEATAWKKMLKVDKVFWLFDLWGVRSVSNP